MPTVEKYRRIAAELGAKADCEPKKDLRRELLTLALAYMRLAEMAERNRPAGPNQRPNDA